jgi:hypothetical protein
MKRILVRLHVLDAVLALVIILLGCMLSEHIPISWLSVIALDCMVVFAMCGEIAIPSWVYASRVLWVGGCYAIELLRAPNDETFACGGAASIVLAMALSIATLRLHTLEQKPPVSIEVVVVVEAGLES